MARMLLQQLVLSVLLALQVPSALQSLSVVRHRVCRRTSYTALPLLASACLVHVEHEYLSCLGGTLGSLVLASPSLVDGDLGRDHVADCEDVAPVVYNAASLVSDESVALVSSHIGGHEPGWLGTLPV